MILLQAMEVDKIPQEIMKRARDGALESTTLRVVNIRGTHGEKR